MGRRVFNSYVLCIFLLYIIDMNQFPKRNRCCLSIFRDNILVVSSIEIFVYELSVGTSHTNPHRYGFLFLSHKLFSLELSSRLLLSTVSSISLALISTIISIDQVATTKGQPQTKIKCLIDI